LPIAAAALPSDVELGLQVLRTQFPEFRKSKVSVPVILMNQLYAIVSDRTQVDRELVRPPIPRGQPTSRVVPHRLSLVQDQLKRKGEIRSFKVHLKTNEFAVLFVEDSRAQIAAERRQLVANKKEDSPIFGVWGTPAFGRGYGCGVLTHWILACVQTHL
jgi:hypothetical protein